LLLLVEAPVGIALGVAFEQEPRAHDIDAAQQSLTAHERPERYFEPQQVCARHLRSSDQAAFASVNRSR
jgi:hypothetical protein